MGLITGAIGGTYVIFSKLKVFSLGLFIFVPMEVMKCNAQVNSATF